MPPTETTSARGTIALTGGTGFIGQHILQRLLELGWHVRALTRRATALAPVSGLIPVVGSLNDERALDDLVVGADFVVHCAGLTSAPRKRMLDRVNRIGTQALVLATVKQAPGAKFLLVSSLAARAPDVSAYAASKLAAEQVLEAYGAGLERCVLRPPAVYGPGDPATLLMFRQFRHGYALRPWREGRFSMLYVEDLADAVMHLIDGPEGWGRTAELHDGQEGGYGWNDIRAAAERQFHRQVRCVPVPKLVLQTLAAANMGLAATGIGNAFLTFGKVNEMYYPDWACRNDLLDNLTSWSARIGVDEGFSRTVSWYKSNGWMS